MNMPKVSHRRRYSYRGLEGAIAESRCHIVAVQLFRNRNVVLQIPPDQLGPGTLNPGELLQADGTRRSRSDPTLRHH